MIRKKINKILFVLLPVLLVCICAANVAFAAEPTYEMSDQYKASYYYDNFIQTPLSGDQVTDVLAIALSQLGYHEGDSDADLGGLSTTGNRDFVEYNVMYGKLDNNQGNGVSYGYYWCASFVNWCLRQAGVSKEQSAAAEVSCHRWVEALMKEDMYEPAHKDYMPKSGDLIFFKSTGSSSLSTHIGIVRYSDGQYVYTIEGNTSDSSSLDSNGEYVCLKKYSLSDSFIVGFGLVNYNTNEDVIKVDYTGESMSPGMYISDRILYVYDKSENGSQIGKIDVHHVFTVTQIKDDWFKIKCVSDNGEIEGWVQSSPRMHQMTSSGQVYEITYNANSEYVLNLPSAQLKTEGTDISISTKIPQKTDSKFLGWSLSPTDSSIAYRPGDTYSADENVTLYAVWDTSKYTVIFKYEDGSIIQEFSGFYGDSLTAPQVESERNGMVFVGWSEQIPDTVTGNAEYTAVYRPANEAGLQTDGISGESSQTGTSDDSKGCRSSLSALLPVMITVIFAAPHYIVNKRK